MSVDCRMPETALDSAARGVAFKLSSRIISAIPGTFLSMTLSVASGVTSRGESPVPPEVTTSRKSSSLARRSRDSIALRSSGKISIEATSNPASVKIRLASGPERSSRFPAAAVSLIVRTNARPNIDDLRDCCTAGSHFPRLRASLGFAPSGACAPPALPFPGPPLQFTISNLANPVSTFPTTLFQESQRTNRNALLHCLAHIVERESRHRYGRHGFHFHAGF